MQPPTDRPNGRTELDHRRRLAVETVWLTQKALAALFGVNVPAVNKHLKNIFESGELSREATISKMEIARPEGDRMVKREVDYFPEGSIQRSIDPPAIQLFAELG